ncbi:hypothetical protein [Roseateles amylovorans]|uniref:MarR family transcriptional regulator n=1 Tax=Roseateles amylovorans TaxID=2978473 RepID=A0ABY6AYF9_9BURK|nr:hypothetical protein [Roseateles amylovorans]UXH77830.1 hypothetical protein N4261_23115 [Roseateles amylovorans]
MQVPHKTELARQMLTQGLRQLPPALRALLITVDGKRDAAELRRLGQGLGLGQDGLRALIDQGLVDLPAPPPDPRRLTQERQNAQERARKLVAAKFFALDLVTRMLAGREADLRNRARDVDTESRFMEWVELCCERIEEHADAERAAMFRSRVDGSLKGADRSAA